MPTLILPVLLSLLAPIQEQDLRFHVSIEEAQAEARRQEIPILAFVVDTAQDGKLSVLFDKEDFEADLQDFVLLVAHPGRHRQVQGSILIDGDLKPRGVCSVYPRCPCPDHQKIDQALQKRIELAKDGEGKVRRPQILFLTPELEPLSHWGLLPSIERWKVEMRLALRRTTDKRHEKSAKKKRARFAKLRSQFLRTSGRKLAILANQLLELPLPEARDFLYAVCRGTEKKAKRRHREMALRFVSMRGNYTALEVVQHCLDDKDVRVREAALEGLAEIRLPAAVPGILERAARLDPREFPRQALGKALLRSDESGEAVRAFFTKELKTGQTKDRVQLLESLLVLEKPELFWRDLLRELQKTRNRRVQEQATLVLATFESRK